MPLDTIDFDDAVAPADAEETATLPPLVSSTDEQDVEATQAFDTSDGITDLEELAAEDPEHDPLKTIPVAPKEPSADKWKIIAIVAAIAAVAVAIAGVMAMRPKCIILDEPTAMLDPSGRKEVIRAVRGLNQVEGVTLILITHYMEEVVDADHVFVMDHGHVVMQGTPREIFSQVDTLKHYRLDVPQVTLLAHELREEGFPVSEGILTKEEFRDAMLQCVRELQN